MIDDIFYNPTPLACIEALDLVLQSLDARASEHRVNHVHHAIGRLHVSLDHHGFVVDADGFQLVRVLHSQPLASRGAEPVIESGADTSTVHRLLQQVVPQELKATEEHSWKSREY